MQNINVRTVGFGSHLNVTIIDGEAPSPSSFHSIERFSPKKVQTRSANTVGTYNTQTLSVWATLRVPILRDAEDCELKIRNDFV
jgi:hypothetical protein